MKREAIVPNGFYTTRLLVVGECGHPGRFRNRWHLQEWNVLNQPLRWGWRRGHANDHVFINVFIAVMCGTAHRHNTRHTRLGWPTSPASSIHREAPRFRGWP